MLHGLKAVDLSTCNLHVLAQHELIIRYNRTWQNLAKCGHISFVYMKVIDLAAKWLMAFLQRKCPFVRTFKSAERIIFSTIRTL